jgi:predicted metalloprotease
MDGQEESSNVEDARGSGGGGGGGFRFGGGGIGIGTIVVALIAGWIFGINPLTLLGMFTGGGGGQSVQMAPETPAARPPAGDPEARFVSQVLRSTEVVWTDVFREAGKTYQVPKLRLYTESERTGCGQGQAAMGPFYCPADQKVYIDLDFYETLKTRLGAPGDFAQAYVIAHEVGHHVQKLLGLTDKVDQLRGRASQAEGNAMSVRLELQADCFAGAWAHHAQNARQILEQGDVEEAMNAAAKIGDDALQKGRGGAIVPESFTHGTSAQRQRWFNAGLTTGSVKACDTFSARSL